MSCEQFPKTSPGIFVHGHLFQKGDLPLYTYDSSGNPITPYLVTYTMYHYAKNSTCPRRVGPENKVPVRYGIGQFYATGIAGECGQPGDWFVKWVYQESVDTLPTEAIFNFKVYDSSQFKTPTQIPCGWCNSHVCCCRRFR